VIHRGWKSLGFRMPKVLGWFITFNFINVSWVFFRAKEWDDAIKVLTGMVNIHMISLAESNFFAIDLLWKIALAFLVLLVIKNTMQLSSIFKPSVFSAILTSMILVYGLLSLEKISEFLYFNF